MTESSVADLHEEQEDLRGLIKVLKGSIRKLEVMLNTPCGDCDAYIQEARKLQERLEAHATCASCGRPRYSRCDVCEPRRRQSP